jgi:hypothetical protein
VNPDWSPLETELARWRAAGLTLPLWWRDDDACRPTPALARLSALAAKLGLPVHLAVIPAHLDPDLSPLLAGDPFVLPLVHGWAHRSHATGSAKKAEFGEDRPADLALAEAGRALAALRPLLGDLPRVFVPPWNRIAPGVTAGLATCGYAALSTFTPRKAALAAPGLVQVNTHLDPIHWRGDRSLLPPDRLIAQIADDLQARRAGMADNDEPYGLLTHHLVHDAPIWQFTEDLLARLLDGPVRPWQLRDLDPKGADR